jgi:hypothetical protein
MFLVTQPFIMPTINMPTINMPTRDRLTYKTKQLGKLRAIVTVVGKLTSQY